MVYNGASGRVAIAATNNIGGFMCRWAIVLNRQMLFVTDEESTVKRFMSFEGFQIYDHLNGCYTYIDHRETDARDLLTEEDYLYYGQR